MATSPSRSFTSQGAVSIWKCDLTSIRIPIVKIPWSHDQPIFDIVSPVHGKTVNIWSVPLVHILSHPHEASHFSPLPPVTMADCLSSHSIGFVVVPEMVSCGILSCCNGHVFRDRWLVDYLICGPVIRWSIWKIKITRDILLLNSEGEV